MAKTTDQPYVFTPSLAKNIASIRTNLRFQAELLRDFDQEEANRVAKRLDRLRWDLKPLAGG
jgi:hypothetical protein